MSTKYMKSAICSTALMAAALVLADAGFDHSYAAYGDLLRRFVHGDRVDYQGLARDRAALDAVVRALEAPPAADEAAWPRAERMAFWINAYNALTLAAIVDHYPIRARWFSRQPKNSIRQIDGVWTTLTWRAAGRAVTLDRIEHEILRPAFKDPRVHFAINCASKSCPPVRAEPYVAGRLNDQLDDAARRYLAGPYGVQLSGDTLRVSSIFNWYGDDFVDQFAGSIVASRPPKERAILGAIARYGPPAAAELIRSGRARVEFLDYDWSLNDIDRSR